MKDALGHGSNPKGTHASRIDSLPRGLRVEKHRYEKTGAKSVGQVWQKLAPPKRRAVAERLAQLARIDNPNHLIRVR